MLASASATLRLGNLPSSSAEIASTIVSAERLAWIERSSDPRTPRTTTSCPAGTSVSSGVGDSDAIGGAVGSLVEVAGSAVEGAGSVVEGMPCAAAGSASSSADPLTPASNAFRQPVSTIFYPLVLGAV